MLQLTRTLYPAARCSSTIYASAFSTMMLMFNTVGVIPVLGSGANCTGVRKGRYRESGRVSLCS